MKSKKVRVWIVWFLHSTGWVALDGRHDESGAQAVMDCWKLRMPSFQYAMTCSLVSPPRKRARRVPR